MAEDQRFPIAPSTAFLALSALVTLRDDDDGQYGVDASAFAEYILTIILCQPATVLAMLPRELDEIGSSLISNCEAWLGE